MERNSGGKAPKLCTVGKWLGSAESGETAGGGRSRSEHAENAAEEEEGAAEKAMAREKNPSKQLQGGRAWRGFGKKMFCHFTLIKQKGRRRRRNPNPNPNPNPNYTPSKNPNPNPNYTPSTTLILTLTTPPPRP
jgi:hypothetical protein